MVEYEEVGNKRRQTGGVGRCWEGLPDFPLIEIAQRLINFEDFEVMHLVCSRWTCILRASNCKFLGPCIAGCCSPQVPWLMMANHQEVQNDEPNNKTHATLGLGLRPCSSKEGKRLRLFFYSLSCQRVRELVISPPDQLYNNEQGSHFRNCSLFSSHGWLLIVRRGFAMSLYTPFCSAPHNYIPLPGALPLRRIHNGKFENFVKIFRLSASPCTKRQMKWLFGGLGIIIGPCSTVLDMPCLASDIFLISPFYQGCLYAFMLYGDMYMSSPLGGEPGVVDVPEKIKWVCAAKLLPNDGWKWKYLWKAYLVVDDDDEGKLFVVVREPRFPSTQHVLILEHDYLTVGFRVFEIVRRKEVKVVKSLGNRCLFVGRDKALSIQVPDTQVRNSGFYGCKPNCIYYTEDRMRKATLAVADNGICSDIGVYNMADGTTERHFQGLSLANFSPFMWFQPRR